MGYDEAIRAQSTVENPRAAGRYLVNRAVIHLGKVSYGAYFWHFAVLWSLEALGLNLYIGQFAGPSLVQFVCVLVGVGTVTVIAATVSWRFIEQPAIRLGRNVAERAAARRPVVIAALPAAERNKS